MRRIKEAVLSFVFANTDLPKIVVDYHEKYKGISKILDENPQILQLAHQDLETLSQGGGGGRSGDFTSETIFRALVVHAIESLSLRETVIRIADSDFLQDFIRTRKKAVMDFTFLDKGLKAIQPETMKKITDLLAQYAVAKKSVDPSVIRTDTTVVESNIHYPTDSSLLWDTYRVASRLLRQGREIRPDSCPYRFHDKKIKGLHLFITRYIKSSYKARRRQVKSIFRVLIERVGRMVEIAEKYCRIYRRSHDLHLAAVAVELESFLPAMATVVKNARRAQLGGEKVPASERVFSIFETHTELIKRGRQNKEVEFGHMVLLCQSREKFITDYDVMEKRVPDCKLTEVVADRHKALFGQDPEVLAGDMGFCPNAEEYAILEERLNTLAIPRRMRDYAEAIMVGWQAFRAGIEGTISGLKRAFRLARCMYRGFKSFVTAVGMGVFTHNLIILAKLGKT